jgi:ribose transport system substrate-binding protein
MRICNSFSRASSSWSRSGCNGAARRNNLRFALVGLLALAGACHRGHQGQFLIGFSQANNAEPWRVAMNADIDTAAMAYPDLHIVMADGQQDNAKQVADVENFLQQKIDLLIISPNEAKPLTAVVERVYNAGIPVIIIDRQIEGDSYTTFIGADNVAIGHAAGEFADSIMNGKADIVELRGLPGSTPAQQRDSGFRAAIAPYPGMKIIHDPVANWLREEAMTQMEAALAAHPHIDLVYGQNDPMAIGAWLAARNAGREHEMKFIGIDGLQGLDGGRQAVKDGKLAATFVYPTGGKEAVETAEKILHGEKVPHQITLSSERITQ